MASWDGGQYFEAGRTLGSLHGTMDDKRLRAGQIMVMQAPVGELTRDLVTTIVQRIFKMTDADVDAFLAMHLLDRTVNK